MNVALIAHDKKKELMVEYIRVFAELGKAIISVKS